MRAEAAAELIPMDFLLLLNGVHMSRESSPGPRAGTNDTGHQHVTIVIRALVTRFRPALAEAQKKKEKKKKKKKVIVLCMRESHGSND